MFYFTNVKFTIFLIEFSYKTCLGLGLLPQ